MRIVAVIPAYNEERTVAAVVRAVRESGLVDETVVVSDGSTDATAEVARRAGARVVELPRNAGKGGAMKAGVEAAPADAFVFLDADLVGLTPEHVGALIEPVASGRAEMTIGLFESGRALTDVAQVLAPHLSGQRAVTAEVLEGIPQIEIARFGVEMALTRHAARSGIRVEKVPLRGLTHVMKEEKMGFLRGFAARMRMYWDIIAARAARRA